MVFMTVPGIIIMSTEMLTLAIVVIHLPYVSRRDYLSTNILPIVYVQCVSRTGTFQCVLCSESKSNLGGRNV